MKRTGSDNALLCSFCHKSQDVVGKLISSPNDYPRAYICDECIAVCNTILEDDQSAPPRTPADAANQQRQQVHALVDEVPPEKLDALIEQISDLLGDRAD
jgi:ATP-dependent Clp protease ATP-binding subunit ClpX